MPSVASGGGQPASVVALPSAAASASALDERVRMLMLRADARLQIQAGEPGRSELRRDR